MAKPSETYTIKEFIDFQGVNKLEYENFCLHGKESEYDIIDYNIIDDYLPELKLISRQVELSDMEFLRYVYKPKLLAYDLYGYSELFFIILKLNNLCSVKDFNIKRLRLLPKNTLSEVLSLIYNSEKGILLRNKNK